MLFNEVFMNICHKQFKKIIAIFNSGKLGKIKFIDMSFGLLHLDTKKEPSKTEQNYLFIN